MISFIPPMLLIVGSLVVIGVVIRNKYSQLSLLDVETIPEVQEEKRKDEYLKKKLEARASDSRIRFGKRVFVPLQEKFKTIQIRFRKYVGSIEREVFHKQLPESKADTDVALATKEQSVSVDKLLQEADTALDQETFSAAESKYIAALAIDPKNTAAYRGLGDLYAKEQHFDEAVETYSFLLQLEPNDDAICVKLADIEVQRGHVERAIEYYEQAVMLNPQYAPRFAKLADLFKGIDQIDPAFDAISQAIELEPENPRYLDNFVELAILSGNQKSAQEGYERLRMANPENAKLSAFKDKIDNMT